MNNLKINIQGKRIESFIKRLIDNNIDLINIEYISYKEINILIPKKDYQKLKKIKTIYKIKIIRKYGIDNIKDIIKVNRILILFIILGLLLLLFLSKVIFNVKVVHNDESLRNLLYQELEQYGIKEHSFKKKKKEIVDIKNKILREYKDKIEWLEIEDIGTSYIIRVEERIIPKIISDNTPRNIVAKKNAIIKNIDAIKGNIEKLRGEYIKKGDIVISGIIKLNENIKESIHAEGKIYGEVWYTLDVSYPYVYQEEKETNTYSNVLSFNFLSKEITFYGKRFKYENQKEKIKFNSTILPIYLSLKEINEIKRIDYILTCDQAINKAIEKSEKIIKSKLKSDEYIINNKIIDTECDKDKANIKTFYAVLENITDYQIIN